MSIATHASWSRQERRVAVIREELPVNTYASDPISPTGRESSRLPRALRFVMLGGLGSLYALSLFLPEVRHALARFAALLPY
jgi:hypothetical protein